MGGSFGRSRIPRSQPLLVLTTVKWKVRERLRTSWAAGKAGKLLMQKEWDGLDRDSMNKQVHT